MADPIDINQNDQDGAFEQMPVEESRRSASMTFRTDDARSARIASMEAANQSLADALRIISRLLYLVMFALLILFGFSGFQQVNEGERGIKVSLGRVTADSLEPGFQFSLPYPLGEIIKVPTGVTTVDILDAFWEEGLDPSKPADRGHGKPSLEPGKDGMLLTADHNIAHAQISVQYHREDPVEYERNLYTDHEKGLIRAAVERAAVVVVSEVTIDDLLLRGLAQSQGASPESSVESRIRDHAQRVLDEVKCGITIDRIALREVRPPSRTAETFRQVNNAVTAAAKERESADSERERTLTAVAGSSYRVLLALIDEYEQQLALGEAEQAERVFQTITDLLDGRLVGQSIQVGDQSFVGASLSGEVATMINQAQQDRSTTVAEARSRAQTFRAKLMSYRANPKSFLTKELADAYTAFMQNGVVETFLIPDDTQPFVLKLTRDPEFQREIERAQKRRDLLENPQRERAFQAGRPTGQ